MKGQEIIKRDYVQMAKSQGAKHVVRFSIQEIEFDSRTILKCMYGCKDYGKHHMCPNERNSLQPWDYERILKNYTWGLLVGTNDMASAHKISLAIERQAFLDGHYFAFSMSDCSLCEHCSKNDDRDCLYPEDARPSFHSVGIDVFATARRFGMPLYTLANPAEDEQNWYAAVFIT